jgi:DNA-binding transcriptional LysR family regulator
MHLRLVEIFCRVYEDRSFSRAAHSLDLTQPTVSVHVRELEDALGTPLFSRLSRGIEPTEAGRYLYEQAQPLLALKEQLRDRMTQFLNRVEGDLRVGASTVPGEYLLPQLVATFQAEHRGVRMHLRIGDSGGTLDDLNRGDVEIAVVGATLQHDDLTFGPFMADTLVLAVPPTDEWKRRATVTLAQLRRLPLLVRETGSGTREVLESALGEHGLSLQSFTIAAELGSTTAIKQAVAQGHGVSFVSALAVATERTAGTLQVVRVPQLGTIARTYYTAVNRRRPLSPLAGAFMSYLDTHREAVRSGRRGAASHTRGRSSLRAPRRGR